MICLVYRFATPINGVWSQAGERGAVPIPDHDPHHLSSPCFHLVYTTHRRVIVPCDLRDGPIKCQRLPDFMDEDMIFKRQILIHPRQTPG